MNFNQRAADLLEQIDANRLVIAKGAAAAIGGLLATQNQFADRPVIIEAVLAQNVLHLMGWRQLKQSRDTALCATLPHQTDIAARANGQTQRVEQNRFTRAGFAGQRA
jgi:hypothetical protein